jgi:uncharacterized protein
MKSKPFVPAVLLSLAVSCLAQQSVPEPIIDMHLHAFSADALGPPPQKVCVPLDLSSWDPKQRPTTASDYIARNMRCAKPLASPLTNDGLMSETLTVLKHFNITAVAGGPPDMVDRWKRAGGDAIIPATGFSPDGPSPSEIRKWIKEGRIAVLAEVGTQYEGIAPNAESLEPFFALAEELDIPVGIHMGTGPPGAPYVGSRNYRARLSSLLLLEDVLVRHPNLRVWAMHAGWPLADDAIATLYTHPQLYVDIGVIDYALPREEFYGYLRRLINAGFESRIMFGSDQMVWPEAIPVAIEAIRSAPFLTEGQKRDILYNNAARFLRLKRQ